MLCMTSSAADAPISFFSMDLSVLSIDKVVCVRAQCVQWYRFLSLDLPREQLHLEVVAHPSPAARICNKKQNQGGPQSSHCVASFPETREEIHRNEGRYARREYFASSDPFRSPFGPIRVELG